ncbi:MAG TPA: peptide chain release factor N(5)-glutamine methyltransferase [Gaiellaceae bacterium]|nr:peptide chain release factor N(5)-glutamine methyltransferase [Gaiellaceae bacterium]
MTLAEVLRGATDYLADKGVPSPRVDAELLLAHALGLQRIELYTQHDRPLTNDERDRARELVRRRGAREPLAYVLGSWGFRRIDLHTDKRALVPRPETEIVVDRVLALIKELDAPRVLDVGTGTGAIALSIAHEHPGAGVTATDLSADALALAKENADRLGLLVDFRQADLVVDGEWDVVVSNPPYVAAEELVALEPEVRDWEPRDALVDAGQTQRLIDAHAGRWLVLEVHEEKAPTVAAAMRNSGYDEVLVTDDLTGRPRVVEGRWMR